MPAWFKSVIQGVESGQWHFTTGAAIVSSVLRPNERLKGDTEPAMARSQVSVSMGSTAFMTSMPLGMDRAMFSMVL